MAPVRIIPGTELSHSQGLLQPRRSRRRDGYWLSWSLHWSSRSCLRVAPFNDTLESSTNSLFVQLVNLKVASLSACCNGSTRLWRSALMLCPPGIGDTAPSHVRYLPSKKSVVHGTYHAVCTRFFTQTRLKIGNPKTWNQRDAPGPSCGKRATTRQNVQLGIPRAVGWKRDFNHPAQNKSCSKL